MRAEPARLWRDHPRSRGVYGRRKRMNPWFFRIIPARAGFTRRPHPRHDRRRIIPARAGFTTARTRPSTRTWDHPRSRGVYGNMRAGMESHGGSSPLARGLRVGRVLEALGARIIPARAGFTTGSRSSCATGSDHPRSRGVYAGVIRGGGPGSGSSPLARGLRLKGNAPEVAARIIPARAGFTASDSPADLCLRGSSPLARGLRGGRLGGRGRSRIIPARAGFTATCVPGWSRMADHPRSRGVYNHW